MYTTLQLITDAFYLSQIVAQDLQVAPTGSQIEIGLNRLNGFIGNKGAKTKLIPFYQALIGSQYHFITGQEKYFFPNLVHIETLTFFLTNPSETNSVRFPMHEETRFMYFGTGRAEGIEALPYQWRQERVLGGTNLYIYFLPQQDYPFEIVGKFMFDAVTLDQDLEVGFERSYIEYMLYGLSKYLCEFYDVEPPRSVIEQFNDFEADLTTQSPMDLTVRKIQSFSGNIGFFYVDANGARGYRPVN